VCPIVPPLPPPTPYPLPLPPSSPTFPLPTPSPSPAPPAPPPTPTPSPPPSPPSSLPACLPPLLQKLLFPTPALSLFQHLTKLGPNSAFRSSWRVSSRARLTHPACPSCLPNGLSTRPAHLAIALATQLALFKAHSLTSEFGWVKRGRFVYHLQNP
jgi:hypothetical protein